VLGASVLASSSPAASPATWLVLGLVSLATAALAARHRPTA
jgi:hypothetical protein